MTTACWMNVAHTRFLVLFFVIFTGPVCSGTYTQAVEQLGYKELARSLPQARVQALTESSQSEALTEAERRALAVLKLLKAPHSPDELVDFVAYSRARDGAYLGELGEGSLYSRIASVWQTSASIPRSSFADDLRALIAAEVANGYNINTTAWPLFSVEHHLVYGHNDIQHAQQLLALMASEGIDAKVGISFKTSAFLHRAEWGEVNSAALDLGEGRYLNEAQEFDLHFEFPERKVKTDFMQMVNRYAKKETPDQPGLIRSAWWQPYYRSLVAERGFHKVSQILITQGEETAVVLVLSARAEALIAEIQNLDQRWKVISEPVWVNPAFYRYLQGDFK